MFKKIDSRHQAFLDAIAEENAKQEKECLASAACVGIFWKIGGAWITNMHLVNTVTANPLGLKAGGVIHYAYWDVVLRHHPEFKGIAFNDKVKAPRGRVIFDTKDNKFYVNLAKVLLDSKSDRAEITRLFLLPKNAEFNNTEHY